MPKVIKINAGILYSIYGALNRIITENIFAIALKKYAT
jgi:hypothetical protein